MNVEQEVKQKKPLSKTEQQLLDELEVKKHPTIVYNSFSGEAVMLQPKAVALYDYIKGYELLINRGVTKNIRQFDMAKELFMKLWPNSYMSLLD